MRYSPPAIGALFALLLPRQRRAILRNLRQIRGLRPVWRDGLDVARTFASFGQCFAEALGAARPEAQAARYRVVGEQLLREALSSPRGVLVLTAHVGPWDAATRALAMAAGQRSVMVLMQSEPNPAAQRLQDGIRQRGGVRILHVGRDPLQALSALEQLRQGGLVAAQLDRVPSAMRSFDVEFIGRSRRVPRGLFQLASLAQVPLLCVAARRVGMFDYEIHFGPPIPLPSDATTADMQRAAQRLMDWIGEFVRKNPTQWFNFDPGQ